MELRENVRDYVTFQTNRSERAIIVPSRLESISFTSMSYVSVRNRIRDLLFHREDNLVSVESVTRLHTASSAKILATPDVLRS